VVLRLRRQKVKKTGPGTNLQDDAYLSQVEADLRRRDTK
jgi:hypothetical protein